MSMELTIEQARKASFSFKLINTHEDTLTGKHRTVIATGEMDAQDRHMILVFPESKMRCQLTKEEWKQFSNAVNDMIALSEREDLA